MTLFLAGCSSNLSDFTKDYNENARKYNVPELVEKEFSEIEVDENMSWQTLFESQKYDINAKYRDGKKVSGYRIVIKDLENFITKEGLAYNATLTVIDTLKLDLKKFNKEFEKMLTGEAEEYTDNGYEIKIFLHGVADNLLYINIDKE